MVHRLEEALQITEALHLTNEQRSKITELGKKQCEQSKALCAKERELHQATQAQILAILSADQQKTVQEIHLPGPHGPGEGGPGLHKGPGAEAQPSVQAPAR